MSVIFSAAAAAVCLHTAVSEHCSYSCMSAAAIARLSNQQLLQHSSSPQANVTAADERVCAALDRPVARSKNTGD